MLCLNDKRNDKSHWKSYFLFTLLKTNVQIHLIYVITIHKKCYKYLSFYYFLLKFCAKKLNQQIEGERNFRNVILYCVSQCIQENLKS